MEGQKRVLKCLARDGVGKHAVGFECGRLGSTVCLRAKWGLGCFHGMCLWFFLEGEVGGGNGDKR